jgi:hypothetical protein
VPPVRSTMQEFSESTAQPLAASSDDRHRMVRGVINGILVSLVVWAAAGYVAFTLR